MNDNIGLKAPSDKLNLYQKIKDDICANRLPIDQLLTQQWLSDYYQLSRIPVRDAILRLAAEGWLCRHGKKGLKVAKLSGAEAEERYLMRLALEPVALEQAFNQLNFTVLGQAEDILYQLDSSTHLADPQPGRLNWRFYLAIYQGCQRPILLRTLSQLHEHCGRYLSFLNSQQSDSLQAQQLRAEQARAQLQRFQWLAALKSKDLPLALTILTQHIESEGENLVRMLQY